MSRALKIHWTIWSILAVITIAGAWIRGMSTESSAAMLRLSLNETTQVSVSRLFADYVRLELYFRGENHRPELGQYNGTDPGSSRTIYHSEPGEPIMLLVSNAGAERVYEVGPTVVRSAYTLGRQAMPFVDDGDPHLFLIRVPPGEYVPLSPGTNVVGIKVLEVGPSLEGESVYVSVTPPLGFKSNANGAYGFGYLSVFGAWPLFVALLGLYGLALHTFRPMPVEAAVTNLPAETDPPEPRRLK